MPVLPSCISFSCECKILYRYRSSCLIYGQENCSFHYIKIELCFVHVIYLVWGLYILLHCTTWIFMFFENVSIFASSPQYYWHEYVCNRENTFEEYVRLFQLLPLEQRGRVYSSSKKKKPFKVSTDGKKERNLRWPADQYQFDRWRFFNSIYVKIDWLLVW